MLFLWMDPDEMNKQFWLFAALMEYTFNENSNRMFTTFIVSAAIMGGIFVTIVLIKLYTSGVFSNRFFSRDYQKVGFGSSRTIRRKIKKEPKKINYICQYCKAPLKESTCEYCGRENFRS